MKRILFPLAVVAVTAPVFAQASGATQIEAEGKGLLDRYVVLFNKGDAAGLVREVYANGDAAALDARFKELRADYSADLSALRPD